MEGVTQMNSVLGFIFLEGHSSFQVDVVGRGYMGVWMTNEWELVIEHGRVIRSTRGCDYHTCNSLNLKCPTQAHVSNAWSLANATILEIFGTFEVETLTSRCRLVEGNCVIHLWFLSDLFAA